MGANKALNDSPVFGPALTRGVKRGIPTEIGVKQVKVVARCRPLEKELEDAGVHLLANAKVKLVYPQTHDGTRQRRAQEFPVDWVECNQKEYYESATRTLVSDFIRRKHYDSAILAYGPTGSGKTYSIQGPASTSFGPVGSAGCDNSVMESGGILQRSLQQVIQEAAKNALQARVCAVEIYNAHIECVRDLLAKRAECEVLRDKNDRLVVRHKADRTVPLVEEQVKSVADAMACLAPAIASRAVRATRHNAASSRSHMLIGISLCQVPLGELIGRVSTTTMDTVDRLATLWIGDLCGSEPLDMKSCAAQQAETKAINTSLMVFKNCLEKLRSAQIAGLPDPHLPVRETSLTRILSDIMCGHGELVMSLHFTRDPGSVEDTRRTMEFAQALKEIRTKPRQRVPQPVPRAGMRPSKRPRLDAVGAATQAAQEIGKSGLSADLRNALEKCDQLARELKAMQETAEEREAEAFQRGVKHAQANLTPDMEELIEEQIQGEVEARIADAMEEDEAKRREAVEAEVREECSRMMARALEARQARHRAERDELKRELQRIADQYEELRAAHNGPPLASKHVRPRAQPQAAYERRRTVVGGAATLDQGHAVSAQQAAAVLAMHTVDTVPEHCPAPSAAPPVRDSMEGGLAELLEVNERLEARVEDLVRAIKDLENGNDSLREEYAQTANSLADALEENAALVREVEALRAFAEAEKQALEEARGKAGADAVGKGGNVGLDNAARAVAEELTRLRARVEAERQAREDAEARAAERLRAATEAQIRSRAAEVGRNTAAREAEVAKEAAEVLAKEKRQCVEEMKGQLAELRGAMDAAVAEKAAAIAAADAANERAEFADEQLRELYERLGREREQRESLVRKSLWTHQHTDPLGSASHGRGGNDSGADDADERDADAPAAKRLRPDFDSESSFDQPANRGTSAAGQHQAAAGASRAQSAHGRSAPAESAPCVAASEHREADLLRLMHGGSGAPAAAAAAATACRSASPPSTHDGANSAPRQKCNLPYVDLPVTAPTCSPCPAAKAQCRHHRPTCTVTSEGATTDDADEIMDVDENVGAARQDCYSAVPLEGEGRAAEGETSQTKRHAKTKRQPRDPSHMLHSVSHFAGVSKPQAASKARARLGAKNTRARANNLVHAAPLQADDAATGSLAQVAGDTKPGGGRAVKPKKRGTKMPAARARPRTRAAALAKQK